MSYASEVLADSPRAWYRMTEASGLIQDSSGNANHATSSSGTAGYAQTSPITSEPADKAINFVGDYFDVPDHATLDVGDVFTVEAWVKRNATTSEGELRIMSKGTGGYDFFLTSDLNGRPVLNIGGTSQVVSGADPASRIEDTNWHHVVITKSGATCKVYKDGTDVTGTVAGGTITDTATALRVGAWTGGGLTFNGLLDEVALYPTALSAVRVSAHYAAATAVSAGGFMLSVAGYDEDDE